MPDPKQGVAQRVLDRIDRKGRRAPYDGVRNVESFVWEYHGAYAMYNEFYTEAQRMLEEEGFERRSHDVNVLTQAFLRLGLNLSPVSIMDGAESTMPEQAQQGVAQRVIGELEAGIGRFHTEAEHVAAVRTSGAQRLYDELSAEARAILAELDDVISALENELPVPLNVLRAYKAERLGVTTMAKRLGLDLESEDAE